MKVMRTAFGLNAIQMSGSRLEGTGVTMLGADIDMMYHIPNYRVIHDCKDWKRPTSVQMVLAETANVHPGYCRLLLMYADEPHVAGAWNPLQLQLGNFIFNDGVFVLHNSLGRYIPNSYRNGPADTTTDRVSELDHVSFMNAAFPPGANEWVHRDRPSQFPPQEFINELARRDILVVPTGHKNSANPDLEWRFSFSKLELDIILMWPINVTKCYVLLKMLKKQLVLDWPELDNTLSSYHLKTTLFWLTEETGLAFWENIPIGECLMLSLKRLLLWIDSGYIPHYFMKDNNLFGLHTGTTRQRDVAKALRVMIAQGPACILRCAHYIYLSHGMNSSMCNSGSPHVQTERTYLHNWFAQYTIRDNRQKHHTPYIHKSITGLCKALDIIQAAILRHGGDGEVGRRLGYIVAELQSSLATSLLSVSLHNRMSNVSRHLLLKITKELLNRPIFGQVCKLKIANFYYQTRQYKMAASLTQVLVEMDFNRSVRLSVVGNWYIKRSHLSAVTNLNSPAEFISNFVSTSLVFGKSEIHAVPYALKFEILQRGSSRNNVDVSRFPDKCLVDPIAFVYFLQYLCFQDMGKTRHAKEAFEKLRWVATQNDRLHRDTTYNIIGHCLMKQGNLSLATKYLVKSIILERTCSAAILHLALVIKKSLYPR